MIKLPELLFCIHKFTYLFVSTCRRPTLLILYTCSSTRYPSSASKRYQQNCGPDNVEGDLISPNICPDFERERICWDEIVMLHTV